MQLLLGLGGNSGDVPAAFARCAAELARHVPVIAVSGLWRSAPLGPPQPEFFNAALLVRLTSPLRRLLALCETLEAAAGRDRRREQRWGPRPLDIDLLIAPGLVVDSPDLVLPHARLHVRRFALLPACELAPDWPHPRLQRPLAELLAALDPLAQPCDPVGAFPAHPVARDTASIP